MTESHDQSDHLQDLLAELRQAEEGGVFRRTPVDPAAMLKEVQRADKPRLVHRLFVGLQAAACIGLLVGVAMLWRGGRAGHLAGSANGPGTDVATAIGSPAYDAVVLAHCVTGPLAGSAGACNGVDFDDDGDVDLEDYGAFQRGFAPGH